MVDELRVWPHARGIFKKGSCHLTTTEAGPLYLQLHEFAESIGLKREWFQSGRVPHYDLTQARRAEAIRMGAVFVPARQQARDRRRCKRCGNSNVTIRECPDCPDWWGRAALTEDTLP